MLKIDKFFIEFGLSVIDQFDLLTKSEPVRCKHCLITSLRENSVAIYSKC